MYASGNGYSEHVIQLLNHNANINATCMWDSDPLSFAIANKKQTIVDLLIKKGAKIYESHRSMAKNCGIVLGV